MADREESRDAAGSGESLPERREDVDQTRAFDPSAAENEGPAGAGGPSGGEQPLRRPAPDETAPYPPIDETPPPAEEIAAEPADETATSRPADETARLAMGEQTAPLSLTPPPWSGRAQVPRPQATVRGAAPPEWDEGDGRPAGRWWMPILVGIVALLLLGILGYGIWLIARSYDGGSAPATPPPSTATATPSRTSAAATTGPPTPTATTARATVPMPPLVGLPEETARAALDRLGLVYRLQFRPSDRTPGTVIETDPRSGTAVPLGTRVTLVIAQARTAPPTTAAPTATATPTPRR